MTSKAYEFMRAYIHFVDNDKRKPKGARGYDVLFKIRYAMDSMIKGMSENQKITNCHYSGHKSYLYLHNSCIICMLIFLEKKKSA
jgi:hypothetical protein